MWNNLREIEIVYIWYRGIMVTAEIWGETVHVAQHYYSIIKFNWYLCNVLTYFKITKLSNSKITQDFGCLGNKYWLNLGCLGNKYWLSPLW